MRQLVQHRTASRGIVLISACADVGVAVSSGLAAPALHGGVVIAVGRGRGGLSGVVDEVLGARGGPEFGAHLDYFHGRGASWGGIGDKDALLTVGSVGALELDSIVVVRAGDALHHILEMGELYVGFNTAEVVRKALVVGGNALGLLGEGDGVSVGLLESALHGGKAGISLVGTAGGRGAVATVGVGVLPSSFVEAAGPGVSAAASGSPCRDVLLSLRCGGGCGGDRNNSFCYHLNLGGSRAVCGGQNNSRTRIQGSIATDIRSS